MATITDRLPCVGVVLAGGHSRRMGRDKAMLDWQGRPLIEHQLALLAAAGVDRRRVSGRRPDHAGISDLRPELGPVGGLAGIAAACRQDCQLLVIPVDMPRLTAPVLERLRTRKPGAACLHFAGHILPMRLRLDADSRAILVALLEADQPRGRSLRALQQALHDETITLAAEESDCLIDCNTPERWKEARP